jgi:GTP-binding protein HflX
MDDRHGRVGGGGRGGKGHTGVELSKQRLRERGAELRQSLEELHATRSSHNERRAETHRVALVGYTNAGKSSLMRALTGSDVLVEDKLFATLGTTVRVLQPETVPRVLVSDTVGFIRNLPHSLVASFRATLAEAHEADLLLHVADSSSPDLETQIAVTEQVLRDLGAAHIPTRLVLNKIDKVDAEQREELVLAQPNAIVTSTRAPDLVAELRREVVAFFDGQLVRFRMALSYADLSRLAPLRASARILSETYDDGGVSVEALCTESEFSRLQASFQPGISRVPAPVPVAEPS